MKGPNQEKDTREKFLHRFRSTLSRIEHTVRGCDGHIPVRGKARAWQTMGDTCWAASCCSSAPNPPSCCCCCCCWVSCVAPDAAPTAEGLCSTSTNAW